MSDPSSDDLGLPPLDRDPVAIALGLQPEIDDEDVMISVYQLRAHVLAEHVMSCEIDGITELGVNKVHTVKVLAAIREALPDTHPFNVEDIGSLDQSPDFWRGWNAYHDIVIDVLKRHLR